jgi:hypothetical protein
MFRLPLKTIVAGGELLPASPEEAKAFVKARNREGAERAAARKAANARQSAEISAMGAETRKGIRGFRSPALGRARASLSPTRVYAVRAERRERDQPLHGLRMDEPEKPKAVSSGVTPEDFRRLIQKVELGARPVMKARPSTFAALARDYYSKQDQGSEVITTTPRGGR